MRTTPLLALLLTLAPTLPAAAATTTTVAETFNGTLEQATWRLGTLDVIEPDGGHPGAYLHDPEFDSAVPTPSYDGPLPSPFFGDYRAASVTSLGLDAIVYAASIGVDHKRPISLVLSSDMGTPDDPTDDCDVYTVGHKNVPRPGTGWHRFEFLVPSQDTTLPAGWVVRGECAGLGPDEAWNAVVTNVTRVTFPFSDPDLLWYSQIWDLGIDDVHIRFGGS